MRIRALTISGILRPIALLICIAICCKLVAIWIRSYGIADQWPGSISARHTYLVASKQGSVAILLLQPHGAPGWWQRQFRSVPVDDELSFPSGDMRRQTRLGFGWIRDPIYHVMHSTQTLPDGTEVTFLGAATAGLRGAGPIVPYWFLTLLIAGMGGVAYMRWPPRFSVRHMFVAITIVAIVLAIEMILGQ